MKICLNISVKKTALFFLFLWFMPVVGNPFQISNRQEVTNEEFLRMAENAYYDEDFNAAIKYAKLYLGQANLTDENKEIAYILVTHIYLALDDAAVAEKSVNKILDINPAYTPTMQMETPRYVNFVNKIKKKYVSKSKSVPRPVRSSQNINWYLWGGAGVAITALAILLLGDDNGKKGQPLSLPPLLPE